MNRERHRKRQIYIERDRETENTGAIEKTIAAGVRQLLMRVLCKVSYSKWLNVDHVRFYLEQ